MKAHYFKFKEPSFKTKFVNLSTVIIMNKEIKHLTMHYIKCSNLAGNKFV